MTNTTEVIVHPSSLGYTARVQQPDGPWAASKHDPFTAAHKAALTFWYGRLNRKELTYDQIRSVTIAHNYKGSYIATKTFVPSKLKRK